MEKVISQKQNAQERILKIYCQAPNPSSGVGFKLIPPEDVFWKIKAFKFSLTTSSATADRFIKLQIVDDISGQSCGFIGSGSAQTASLAVAYSFIEGYGATPYRVNGVEVLPFINNLTINKHLYLQIDVPNIDTNDQISGITIIYEQVYLQNLA